ncbi:MAG: MFS transporter [Actinobacteria bacterium]|nr:MFS transporter [Actinomycetota bacterium]
MGAEDSRLRAAVRAVYAVFIGNGFAFASWASRIPQVKDGLQASPGVLGLVLLGGAAGATLATVLAGLVITWLGQQVTVAAMALLVAAGLALIAVGYRLGIAPVAAGLSMFGFGSGTWDVAMNVEGAAAEHRLGRAIMPRFHAGWSIGTVAGAGTGAAMVALRVPVTVHLVAVAVVLAVTMPAASRGFLPAAREGARAGRGGAVRSPLAAWTEPRTLLIGLFVLCLAFTEGTGNDWLSLAVIGGYHAEPALGTATFAVFLAAMTAGRWFGPRLIDARGRVPVLRASAGIALAGLLLIVLGPALPVAVAGAVLLGLGTSLGFPVGLSAAADDPAQAAGRVSTAASIGYTAFLAGPPIIGFLGDQVGVLRAISVTGVLLAAALVLCRATAPLPAQQPAP